VGIVGGRGLKGRGGNLKCHDDMASYLFGLWASRLIKHVALLVVTRVWKELGASIFYPEDGGSRFV
jgi:hypothetical protein